MGVFEALPLFTWFFVLGCHIISITDDIASLWAHNEEVVVAQGLVSLHWGYHRMLGHAIVQVWTYLAVDRFILASMITVCIYFKKSSTVYLCFLCRRTVSRIGITGSVAYFPRQIHPNPVIAYYWLQCYYSLQYQLNIKTEKKLNYHSSLHMVQDQIENIPL